MKKSFYCLLFLLAATNIFAQLPCSNVKLLDQGMWENDLSWPLHKLRKQYNTDKIPAAIQEKIKAAIIAETSPAFFEQLLVKQVRICDSATKERLKILMDYYDSLGNRINNFYFIYYELKLNGNIAFVFRMNFTEQGKLFDVEYGDNNLKYISTHLNKILSCEMAVGLALKDDTAAIKEANDIFLYYNPRERSIAWQVHGPLKQIDAENGTADIKLIDAVTGRIVGREVVRWHSPAIIKDVEIGTPQKQQP